MCTGGGEPVSGIQNRTTEQARKWVAWALRPDRDSGYLPDPGGFSAEELVDIAEEEGVLTLLDWELRSRPCNASLPDSFRDDLATRARSVTAESLYGGNEVRRVASALSEAGIRALLLKGHALALWLYPQPTLRTCGDIDLLLESRADADRAAEVLKKLGYALAFNPGAMFYEMSSRLIVGGRVRSEVDLHSRLINVPVYADRLGFAELWEHSIALPGLDTGIRGLSIVYALIHACMHRAVDLFQHGPEKLKWHYEIHLLLSRMDQASWANLRALCLAKGLSGVCLRSFDDAVSWFGGELPVAERAALQRAAAGEQLDYRRIDDWRYIQWLNFKVLPDAGARLRWLAERLVPTTSHLQELYGREVSLPRLLGRRMGRMLARLRNRE